MQLNPKNFDVRRKRRKKQTVIEKKGDSKRPSINNSYITLAWDTSAFNKSGSYLVLVVDNVEFTKQKNYHMVIALLLSNTFLKKNNNFPEKI